MGIEELRAQEVLDSLATSLRLPYGASQLFTTEGAAALLRRVAALCCPCPARTILDTALRATEGLIAREDLRSELKETLDLLTGCGDLVIVERVSSATGQAVDRVALGPSRFLRLASGRLLLLGIEPDGASLVPDEVWGRVALAGELRFVLPMPGESLEELLSAWGFAQVSQGQYADAPSDRSPEEVVREYDRRLATSPGSAGIDNIEIVRPETSPTYYSGRWGQARNVSANVVGRRPRRYGAPLWCYMELADGLPRRLLDLGRSGWRGCDEAWYLLAAKDAVRGQPQRYLLTPGSAGAPVRLDIYSPVPKWVQRWLALVSTPVARVGGALLSFEVSPSETAGISDFLSRRLWMAPALS